MRLERLPLSAYLSFQAKTLDCLAENIETKFGARIVDLAKPDSAMQTKAYSFALPSSQLWFCSYGLPITLRFPEGDAFRIQFCHAGTGATQVGQAVLPVTPEESCIVAGKADVVFGGDFQQLAWRLPRALAQQKLTALTDEPALRPIEFDHALDMTTPEGIALRQILQSLLQTIETPLSDPARFIFAELQSALIVSLLCASNHNCRDLLNRPARIAAPWQVRRAEDYIEAHWDEPLTIDALVAATGASARSIFRTFKKFRGYSPFQFAKQVRLRQSRRLLLDAAEARTTVTEIALACGFENLSRFSKDFAQAFGESPSVARNRGRTGRIFSCR